VLISLIAIPGALGMSTSCTAVQVQTGSCDVSANLNNDSATLGGTVTAPGADAPVDYSGAASSPDDPLADCVYILNGRCLKLAPGRTAPVQPITIADLVSFRPNPGTDTAEPDGWTVIGLATNFIGSSVPEVHDGTLLGQSASVRFTPVAWHWAYGDGTTASLGTGGATWEALGIGEFDQTPTSHAFRTAGTYTVELTIDYAAEYRFGATPWTPIAGTLSLAANPITLTAGDAKTVLVGRDCTVNPAGPGC